MNTKILSFVLVSFLLAFMGCKDDEGTTTPTTATKTKLISASPWILKSLTINPGADDGDGNIITNLYDTNEACDNDDEIIYNANGTGSYNEGATKCDPDGDQELGSFTWSFNSAESQLIEDGETYDLGELSESKMIQQSSFNEEGTNYTITATYTH